MDEQWAARCVTYKNRHKLVVIDCHIKKWPDITQHHTAGWLLVMLVTVLVAKGKDHLYLLALDVET